MTICTQRAHDQHSPGLIHKQMQCCKVDRMLPRVSSPDVHLVYPSTAHDGMWHADMTRITAILQHA